jgi:hypothetical protein
MSAKLIIWVPGKPLLNGYKQREFIWSEAHKCYIYGGSEIDASKFNELYEKAVRNNFDMNPRVKVVDVQRIAIIEPPPITTITAQEITAEKAEEVLQRLAPERLKKKPGPKPAIEVA